MNRDRRALQLFELALDVPADRLDGFFRETCGDDVQLRRRVESLLAIQSDARDFLPATDRTGPSRILAEMTTDVDEVETVNLLRRPEAPVRAEIGDRGERIESGTFRFEQYEGYQIRREIGRGGMGIVYEASQASFGRHVAVKVMPDHAAGDEQRVRRFLREAELNSVLEHPGIVPVHGTGRDIDGRPFYVMRFVRGESLREAIDAYHDPTEGTTTRDRDPATRSLQLRELLRRFLDVCNAIAFAHSRGVIHRDIKPENILLGPYGETLIVDWGLAKLHRAPDHKSQGDDVTAFADLGSAETETMAGQILGTPRFMSPEQATGDLDRVGPASDIYSLGATLYCVLTGHAPIEGSRPDEVLAKVGRGEIRPPRDVCPGLPPALEAITLKAMALQPEDRYGSAGQLAEDLERWLADEPVSAYREPWTLRLSRWLTRHRTPVMAVVASLVVALVGVGGLATIQWQGRADLAAVNGQLLDSNRNLLAANRREAQARRRAEGRIELALGAIEQFREAVETHLEVKDRPENTPLRRDLLQAPLAFYQQLRDDLLDDAAADPEARFRLAEALESLGMLSQQLGSGVSSIEQLREAADLFGETARDADASVDLRQRARDQRVATLVELGTARADVLGDRDAALADFANGRTLAEVEVAARPDDPTPRENLARILFKQGRMHFKAGAMERALAHAEQAVEQIAPASNRTPDDAETLELLNEIRCGLEVLALRELGRYDEALNRLDTVRNALQRINAGGEPDRNVDDLEAKLFRRYAEIYLRTGREREELDANNRQVEVQRVRITESPSAFDPRRALALALLDQAMTLKRAGQPESSRVALTEARAILDALQVDFPRTTGLGDDFIRAANLQGTLAYQQGRLEEAVEAYREVSRFAARELQNRPSERAPRVRLAGNEYNLGMILDSLGRADESRSSYDRSEGLWRRLVTDFPDQPAYQLNLAHALANRGGLAIKVLGDLQAGLRDLHEAVGLLEDLARAYPNSTVVADSLARNTANLCEALLVDLRFHDAEVRAREMAGHFESRVEAEPDVLQARLDLAFTYRTWGDALRNLNRDLEADRQYREAIALLEPIVKSGADRSEAAFALATTELKRAQLLSDPTEAEQSAGLASRSAARLESLRASGRFDEVSALRLFQARRTYARRLAQLGLRAEAETAWDRAEGLRNEAFGRSDPEATPDPQARLELRAWADDLDGFLDGAERLVNDDGPPEEDLVSLAIAASLASTRTDSSERVDDLIDRAINWLERAHALGWFHRPERRTTLFGSELAPLRQRRGFQQILLNVAFPDNPFYEQQIH